MQIIDVWNPKTFDSSLLAELHAEKDLLRDYAVLNRNDYLERETANGWQLHKPNPFAASRMQFVEHVIMPAMVRRTIRAWHYTRLTDIEASRLKTDGIYVSTLATIRQRLDSQVSDGTLPKVYADALYEASPFHHQKQIRENRFWMHSHPLPIQSGGVKLLLSHWGGEGVYFWLKDAKLINQIQSFGRPRVIELDVPIKATAQAYFAARAVVSTFVKSIGIHDDCSAFDLYTTEPLTATSVLAIHTEGERDFGMLASGYPAEFFDPDV